jgi:hypothetical protein
MRLGKIPSPVTSSNTAVISLVSQTIQKKRSNFESVQKGGKTESRNFLNKMKLYSLHVCEIRANRIDG